MFTLGKKWSIPAARMSYDRLGIGRNMVNHLAKWGLQNAIGYAGEASPMDSSFTNLRTEAGWKLRQRLDPSHVPDLRALQHCAGTVSHSPGAVVRTGLATSYGP